jgi:hypothetical protein
VVSVSLEAVTLVAALIAAVAAMVSAGISARASRKQVDASVREGQLTRENAERLARRAELQADITRLTDWAVNGRGKRALFAMRQLQLMLENPDLDERQLGAVYDALLIAHETRFQSLDQPDPPQLPATAEALDAADDTEEEEEQ